MFLLRAQKQCHFVNFALSHIHSQVKSEVLDLANQGPLALMD